MSELCNYEFEDVAWDEFCQSADTLAPDLGFQQSNDHFIPGDNLKKRHHEITSTLNNIVDESTARYVDCFTPMSKRRNTMLEKDTYSDSPIGESMDKASSSVSENTRSPSHGFKSNNPDFDFFENGWPELGNFEDIDGMLGGCDSAFGLGSSKEDELGWFSSADDMGDVLKSDFKFPCLDPNVVKNISDDGNSSRDYSIDGSVITSAPIRHEETSSTSENSDMYMSFAMEPPIADSKDGFIASEQIVEDEKLLNQKSQPGNCSFHRASNLPTEGMPLPSGDASHQAFASVPMQQQQHAAVPDSNCYLQNLISYGHSDTSHLHDPSSVNPTVYAVKSEPKDLISPSQKDSTQVSTLTGYEKGEKLHNHSGFRSSVINSLKNTSAMVEASTYDPGSVENSENHGDSVRVSLPILSEVGSSNLQEGTSGLDDISLEAGGFCQLQHVMEQLDLKTKLCIRNSLYRLARSAELRHNQANLEGTWGDERDTNDSFIAEGTNRYTSFMDIETDTNPIDRSVAHLLFHRSSDSSATPGPRACTTPACNV